MSEKKLTIGTNAVEDVVFVKLSGVIDEDNTLARTTKKLSGRTLVLDLAEVKRINSCGVRDWVNWLSDLHAKGKTVILTRCSPCIVTQLNLVNNFVGSAMVRSFFAPYYCASCDLEVLCLLQVEDFAGQAQPRAPRPGDPRTPNVQCPRHTPQCDLEFDDIEEAYFAFLPRDAGNTVDPALASHIEALSPNLRARIERLDKVASDGGTPVSGSYSPLTHTSVSLARDSLNLSGPPEAPPAPPANPKSQLPIVLMIAAIALVGVIAWVVFGGL
jgi:anti-anti-sigma regulatory factor